MKILIEIILVMVIIGNVVSIMYEEWEEPNTDIEKEEELRKQLNDWQDRDILKD